MTISDKWHHVRGITSTANSSLSISAEHALSAELVTHIRALVADLRTYGYHRVHVMLRRQAEKTGREAPNPERIYRVMRVHTPLRQRDGERREERRHDGKVALTSATTTGAQAECPERINELPDCSPIIMRCIRTALYAIDPHTSSSRKFPRPCLPLRGNNTHRAKDQ